MDKEMLGKMLNKGHQDVDSKIAKMYLIKHHSDLIDTGNKLVKFMSKEDLKNLGIEIVFNKVSFHKSDFPELWEKQEQ